jgi:glycosyltransferase involved in cell wall biosynthesis
VTARLTVGLPVRNGERFLAEVLANLSGQTLKDLEIVVSDNASSDGTGAIARAAAAADPRISYRRQPCDVGANANFNAVFAGCDSDYVCWSAVDDLRDLDLLAACVDALDADPGAVLAQGRTRLIDAAGQVAAAPVVTARAEDPRPRVRFAEVLQTEVWCTAVFGVIRRAALDRTAMLGPFYGADKVLLAQLALLGRFCTVEDRCFYRRCHDDQSTVLDARAKARWTAGRATARPPAVVRASAAYLAAAAGADLPPRERLAALAAVARTAASRDKLAKLVRPGPYNYLGWRGRVAVDPYAGVDLTPVPGGHARSSLPPLHAEEAS